MFGNLRVWSVKEFQDDMVKSAVAYTMQRIYAELDDPTPPCPSSKGKDCSHTWVD